MVFAERVLATARSLPKADIRSGQQTGSKRPKSGFAQLRGIEAREARKAA